MANIDAKMVSKLRKETGAPMMDCKRALQNVDGDWEKAKEELRLAGLKAADSRSGRQTAEGRIFSYIHAGDKIGVMVELHCETDFVAKNEMMSEFGHDLCLHLAFAKPQYLDASAVPAEEVEKETAFLRKQIQEQAADKPAEIQEKMVEGRLKVFFEERCFLNQKFVKDNAKTIEDYRKELVGKIGENIKIARFTVFVLGE
ncbi:MAG: elongation factor Ts [Planctomycetota bacterium]|nr:MAG: elongation factor Ts [Planctomycetota bacterium]